MLNAKKRRRRFKVDTVMKSSLEEAGFHLGEIGETERRRLEYSGRTPTWPHSMVCEDNPQHQCGGRSVCSFKGFPFSDLGVLIAFRKYLAWFYLAYLRPTGALPTGGGRRGFLEAPRVT